MTNEMISSRLLDYAKELQREGENLYRVRSYRQAGFEVMRLPHSLHDVFQQGGRRGLERLPCIGRSISFTIEGLLTTGEFTRRKVA